MATRRTLLPVLLLAFALVAAGGLMEGVRGAPRSSSSMSSVRRRLSGNPLGVGAGAAYAATNCGPLECIGLTPTCCRVSSQPNSLYFCAATGTDVLNCGGCGKICQYGSICCGGVCTSTWEFQSDLKNCGLCGHKCGPNEKCQYGLCSYNSYY